MTKPLPLLFLVLAACADERGFLDLADDAVVQDTEAAADTDWPDVPVDTDVAPDCVVEVAELEPAVGAVDVPLGTRIRALLVEADETATLSVDGPDGPLDGTSEVQAAGMLVRFTPETPVHAGTSYVTRVDGRCGEATFAWSTRTDVIVFDLSTAYVVKPLTTVALASAFRPLWLRLDGWGGDRVELVAAVAKDGAQDPCALTTSLAGDAASDGLFEIAAPSVVLGVGDGLAVGGGVRLQGRLDPARGKLSAGTLKVTVDAAALAPALLGDGATGGELCGKLGVCRSCGTGRPSTCFDLELASLSGQAQAVSVVDQDRAAVDAADCP